MGQALDYTRTEVRATEQEEEEQALTLNIKLVTLV